MLLKSRFDIRPIPGLAEGAHPPDERGGAVERMATGIIDQGVLDDRVDRSTLLASQFMREVAGLGASNGELRGGHAIKIAP